jgi:signal transduction histidine kinase
VPSESLKTQASPADRDREHASPAPSASAAPSGDDVSPEVWQAFERVMNQARAMFDGAAETDEVGPFLLALTDAVRRAVTGAVPSADPIPTPPPAARILEHVRRAFVDEVCTDSSDDARHAMRVLRGLGDVQRRLERAAATGGAYPVIEREALGLIVEVAHDMRSPLAAILFLIDMLRTGRGGGVTALQARQLGMVYGATLGLNQLACDLIDFARGHAGLIGDHPVPFSVLSVFHSVRDIVQPMAEERGTTMSFAPPSDHARLGFPVALNRILLNLTTNAVKFAKQGAVTVAARQLSATRIEFSVHDTGRGIPDSVMAQLFQPFRRPRHATSSSFSSSGLGLSICHKLVTALGSEIHVTTSDTDGTRFAFELDLPLAGE